MAAPIPPSREPMYSPPVAAAPPPGGEYVPYRTDPDPFPPQLARVVGEIEAWASANAKDARRDRVAYWALKTPAIVSSALSGVLVLKGWQLTAVILAGIATVCVLIDGLQPRGALRNAHWRAVHELRGLSQSIRFQWDEAVLRRQARDDLAADILRDSRTRIQQIGAALQEAESLLGANESKVLQSVSGPPTRASE